MKTYIIRSVIVSMQLILLNGYICCQCIEDVNVWAESWSSCVESVTPNPALPSSHWILYEFDEAIEIVGTHIWNANKTGESSNGLKDVDIHVSYDGSNWNKIGTSSFLWPQAPESQNYAGFAGPALNEHGLLTKVLITSLSTYGNGQCASLSEIRFDINPDACDGVKDECNVCDGPGKYSYYLDADNDGLGNPNVILQACQFPAEGYVTNNLDDCDTGGWAQMGVLFDSNGCTGCHNSTSPSGLDLLSYDGFINGGIKCGSNLQTGTTLVDIITVQGYAGCSSPIQGQSMNDRVGGAIDDFELLQIQAWIDAGTPEFDCPICPNVDDELLGTACDDNDPCTDTSIYGFDCECNPRENLALQGTPSMSSIFNSTFDESHLNDDIVNTDISATTADSPNEWMQIDLANSNLIKEVVIWNRINCCLDRQNNIYVMISENPFPANTDLMAALANASFSYQLGDVSGKQTIAIQADHTGRYVRIQKSGNNGSSNILNIHELQVFGYPIFEDVDGDGVCDALDQCPNVDDSLIGQSCDDNDVCTTGESYNTNCECTGGSFQDTDSDGICDALDQCPNMDDSLIGQSCDDNDMCTIGESYNANCECTGGIFQDEDSDGVCDANDLCPGGDDTIDSDNDGTPDFCDTDCETIAYDDFESNAALHWTSGGIDAELLQSTNSPSGDYSFRIRDNSFETSSIFSNAFNLSQLDNLVLNFDFRAVGMEQNESFYLEISSDGGTSYSIVKQWTSGTDFMNGLIYQEQVELSNQVLSSQTILKFRCNGSINSDEVFLDNIHLESCDDICQNYVTNTDNSNLSNSLSAETGIESNNIIPVGANVEFSAGETIHLFSGFEVEMGAVFHAYISPCHY